MKFSDSGLYLSNDDRNQHRIRCKNHAKRGNVHIWLEAETKTRDKEKKWCCLALKVGLKRTGASASGRKSQLPSTALVWTNWSPADIQIFNVYIPDKHPVWPRLYWIQFQNSSQYPVTRQSSCCPLTIQSEHDKQVLRLHARSDYFALCLAGVNSNRGTGISQWHFPWCTEMLG